MPELHLQSTIHLTGHRFEVVVRLCPDDQPSLELFGDYITARTHACGLRRVNGWRVSDEIDAATKRKAEGPEERRIEAKLRGG